MDNIISIHWNKAVSEKGFRAILNQVPPLALRKVLQRPAVRQALREFLLYVMYEENLTFKFKEWGADGVVVHPVQLSRPEKRIAIKLTKITKAASLQVVMRAAAHLVNNNEAVALTELSCRTPCAKVIVVLNSEFRAAGYQLRGPKLDQLNTLGEFINAIAMDKYHNWKEFEYFWNTQPIFRLNYLRPGVWGEDSFDDEALNMSPDDLKQMHDAAIQQALLSFKPKEPFVPREFKSHRRQQLFRSTNEDEDDEEEDGDMYPEYSILDKMPKRGVEALQLTEVMREQIEGAIRPLRSHYKLDARAQTLARMLAQWGWLSKGRNKIQNKRTTKALKYFQKIIEHHDPRNDLLLRSVQKTKDALELNEVPQWQTLYRAVDTAIRTCKSKIDKELAKYRGLRRARIAEYLNWQDDEEEKQEMKKRADAETMAMLEAREDELEELRAGL